jgi:hypothetical protein
MAGSTWRSVGVADPPEEPPTHREGAGRLTGGMVWADHARLLVAKLAHLRLPQAEEYRVQARALALVFDAWEQESPEPAVRRAKMESLFELSERVAAYLGE